MARRKKGGKSAGKRKYSHKIIYGRRLYSPYFATIAVKKKPTRTNTRRPKRNITRRRKANILRRYVNWRRNQRRKLALLLNPSLVVKEKLKTKLLCAEKAKQIRRAYFAYKKVRAGASGAVRRRIQGKHNHRFSQPLDCKKVRR